ncbi:hypothetical protein [Diaphorobacter caeni]|nr:hypothetical protein [Diaphorobacter caeni]MBF5005334.1 hypothetical protein [Diaphorobacter caeni]
MKGRNARFARRVLHCEVRAFFFACLAVSGAVVDFYSTGSALLKPIKPSA